jgi:hypothetical protein
MASAAPASNGAPLQPPPPAPLLSPQPPQPPPLLRLDALGLVARAALGRRVRFTALDASERHLCVGANTGSVYCFSARGGGGGGGIGTEPATLLRVIPFSGYIDEGGNPEPVVQLRFRCRGVRQRRIHIQLVVQSMRHWFFIVFVPRRFFAIYYLPVQMASCSPSRRSRGTLRSSSRASIARAPPIATANAWWRA